jgi:Ser/Thr protein kinase RdoA (MazF antagonist)
LVAILDFEAACEDALLFDIAMAIHGFCFPDEQWSPELADAFVGAYSERRPLDEAEREALPTYLRWCPLAMMGWHLQELIRRPDEGNERRAAEFARRITTMRKENWAPSWD